eukprot:jgi/Bigna1/84388/fgenesh1_pg.133_\
MSSNFNVVVSNVSRSNKFSLPKTDFDEFGVPDEVPEIGQSALQRVSGVFAQIPFARYVLTSERLKQFQCHLKDNVQGSRFVFTRHSNETCSWPACTAEKLGALGGLKGSPLSCFTGVAMILRSTQKEERQTHFTPDFESGQRVKGGETLGEGRSSAMQKHFFLSLSSFLFVVWPRWLGNTARSAMQVLFDQARTRFSHLVMETQCSLLVLREFHSCAHHWTTPNCTNQLKWERSRLHQSVRTFDSRPHSQAMRRKARHVQVANNALSLKFQKLCAFHTTKPHSNLTSVFKRHLVCALGGIALDANVWNVLDADQQGLHIGRDGISMCTPCASTPSTC